MRTSQYALYITGEVIKNRKPVFDLKTGFSCLLEG